MSEIQVHPLPFAGSKNGLFNKSPAHKSAKEQEQVHGYLQDLEKGSRSALPVDVLQRFDEVDKYHEKIVTNHRTIRRRLLSVLSGGKYDDELDRWAKYMTKLEDEDSVPLFEKDLASFIYGCDVSIMRSASPEQVWTAIKRRAAFQKKPLRMCFLTASQIIFCIIIVISQNQPVANSTLIMALLFIVCQASSNPLKICRDAINYIKRGAKVIGNVPMALLVTFLFPIVCLIFTVTFTLDMTIGDIIDMSYAGMMNQFVRIVVVFTAVSVGLRSGSPISAIQTFAGFDFIDSMDEIVIDSFDIDYEELVQEQCVRPAKGDSCKILTVRLSIYFSVPILMLAFSYITYTNNCYLFCTPPSS